jgi:hypothetical protein
VSDDTDETERFLSLVADLQTKDPRLTSVQAALVIAAEQDIAHDSRTFARVFGVAHALVLRELNALVEMDDRLQVVKRDPRTLRTFYVLHEGIAEAK